MLFQNAIDTLDLEIRELQAQIEAKSQQQNDLIQLEAIADATLETLSEALVKIRSKAPEAITQLKSTVLTLFNGSSDDDGGKDRPADPTPEPPDNSETTEQGIEPSDQPVVKTTEPVAPAKMVHLGTNCGYLKLETDSRILAAYAWFSSKAIAQAWLEQIKAILPAEVELRETKRHLSWKWELKIQGLNIAQVERLSKEVKDQKPAKEALVSGLSTSGNYVGLSRQVKRYWEKADIDPNALIADMRANRPRESEWNAAKYNPILAAVGAEDASDF